MEILSEPHWHSLRDDHEARVRPWIDPRLRRMSLGENHPVDDFLFDYYRYRPGQLLRWHPGWGVALENADEYLTHKGYQKFGSRVTASISTLSETRRQSLSWLCALLQRTADRPTALGCFGLHEWAMLYRSETVRHESWPLRLSPAAIAATVDSIGPRCTHYDALRFFTPAARPMNAFQPTRHSVADFEQPGCLHANMDLYKWAFKLAPFCPSSLVADCFALAQEIRRLDMQASPYDFSALGLAPICIETPGGRLQYETAQREFSRRATPLRQRLIALCQRLIGPQDSASFPTNHQEVAA